MYTRVYIRVDVVNLSPHARAYTNRDFDDHFHLEMIVNINVIILERVLADSIEKKSRQSSEDMFHDEIVQEIKEQLGPSYNSLSLYSDSLCLLIIKLISPILKVVDETNNINHDLIFIW